MSPSYMFNLVIVVFSLIAWVSLFVGIHAETDRNSSLGLKFSAGTGVVTFMMIAYSGMYLS